jgi:hypothetical protein
MSDDLVKRLRNFPMLEGSKLCREAASRIEKLEAALRKYADEEYNGYNANGGYARKILEGKDD